MPTADTTCILAQTTNKPETLEPFPTSHVQLINPPINKYIHLTWNAGRSNKDILPPQGTM